MRKEGSDDAPDPAHLVAEVLDALVQVVGFVLQLVQRLVLSSQSPQELVFAGVQQVLGDSPGLFGPLHRTERTGHRGVAFLLCLHRLIMKPLHFIKLIC